MYIDVKALDECLARIPMHERLKLPYHVGRHLENAYRANGIAGREGRKKKMAELREEWKRTRVEDAPTRVGSDNYPKLEKKEIWQTEIKPETEHRGSTQII